MLGWHTVHHFATAVTPVLAGNRLKMSLDLSPSSGVMAMTYVGVAAAVAIPAFIKYTSRSKDAAAQMNGTLVH